MHLFQALSFISLKMFQQNCIKLLKINIIVKWNPSLAQHKLTLGGATIFEQSICVLQYSAAFL